MHQNSENAYNGLLHASRVAREVCRSDTAIPTQHMCVSVVQFKLCRSLRRLLSDSALKAHVQPQKNTEQALGVFKTTEFMHLAFNNNLS